MALLNATAVISTDGSGDGNNASNGRTLWSADFQGVIIGVRLEYNGAAAGSDVTLSEPRGIQRSFLTATDTNTDTTYLQSDMSYTNNNISDYIVDSQNLQVAIAQGGASVTNALKVIVTVLE